MNGKCKQQRGFTLIELLIAITIFAIGLLSIASMQITALQVNSRASTLSAVTGVAEGILEEILSWSSYDNTFKGVPGAKPAVVWNRFDPASGAPQTSISIDGAGTYQASYVITVDDPVANISKVEVFVTGPRNLTLTGYKRYVTTGM